MSGVAKQSKMVLKPVAVEKYDPPTTMHINLKKHKMTADVGKKVAFKGHGVVKSIRKDDYEHRAEIEIHKLHQDGDADDK